jgi:hypothetical protein
MPQVTYHHQKLSGDNRHCNGWPVIYSNNSRRPFKRSTFKLPTRPVRIGLSQDTEFAPFRRASIDQTTLDLPRGLILPF